MNKKLYVGNLSFSAEEADLQAYFAGEGRNVESVRILTDRATGRSRGFGFVEMATPEDAQRAINELNGKEFQGRALNISEAREQPAGGGGGRGGFGGGGGGGRGGYGGGGGGRGGRDRDGGGRGGYR